MNTINTPVIFDGHNDMLLRLWEMDQKNTYMQFFDPIDNGHINRTTTKTGCMAGGMCAIFPPNTNPDADNADIKPQLDHTQALSSTMGMAALLARIERYRPQLFKICRTVQDIDTAFKTEQFAAVFHIEGAEAIGDNLDELYVLHQAGLRSLGPVWSRPNNFAFGVPFRFPSTPDIGPGLSERGKELIRVCNELNILIDLSHMNEKGFWDIAKLSDAPLVATHSNAHALCASSRNLTDKQIDAIGESGGLIGINYGVIFLREDGKRLTDTPLETIIRHIDYIATRIGIDHVALGSDFDGTTVPRELSDASKLPALINAMRQYGFDLTTIEKICHKNWLRTLKATWKN